MTRQIGVADPNPGGVVGYGWDRAPSVQFLPFIFMYFAAKILSNDRLAHPDLPLIG